MKTAERYSHLMTSLFTKENYVWGNLQAILKALRDLDILLLPEAQRSSCHVFLLGMAAGQDGVRLGVLLSRLWGGENLHRDSWVRGGL